MILITVLIGHEQCRTEIRITQSEKCKFQINFMLFCVVFVYLLVFINFVSWSKMINK